MIQNPNWAKLKYRFAPDGTLRDVYVLDTTPNEWELFLAFLATPLFSAKMWRGEDRIAIKLPEDFPILVDDKPRPLLQFNVAGVLCASHFFSDDMIEFDIDPKEMQTEEQFDAFVSFLGQLRDRLGKDVVLTEENAPDDVILRLPANKD